MVSWFSTCQVKIGYIGHVSLLSYYSHNMTRVTSGFSMIEDFGNVKTTLQNYKSTCDRMCSFHKYSYCIQMTTSLMVNCTKGWHQGYQQFSMKN